MEGRAIYSLNCPLYVDMEGGTGLSDKHLMVVTHTYNVFVKEQVDELAKYFDRVTVLVRYNRLLEVSSYLPVSFFYAYSPDRKIQPAPEGVTVLPTPLIYLPIELWRKRLGDQHYRKIRRVLSDEIDPDLVHAHFTWTAGYAGVRLANSLDVPAVVTVHENQSWFGRELQSDNRKIRWTWTNSDVIIRVNEKDVEKLQQFNDDVVAIPNGYSRSRYERYEKDEARDELGLGNDRPIIFSLGNLEKRKGYHILIRALERIQEQMNDFRCFIGGTGPKERELRKQIANSSVAGQVELLGFVPEADLSKWMHAADVLALPSLAEGNPTVMFEALGCGRPYVGSNVGGVDEIITDELGLYCEPGDPEALADILVEGLERDWDEEAIRRHAKQYRWSEIADQIAEVYRSLLANSRDARPEDTQGEISGRSK